MPNTYKAEEEGMKYRNYGETRHRTEDLQLWVFNRLET